MSCYRCNSHVGSAVSYFIVVHKVFVHSSRLICSLMMLSAISRLRLDFHHIKSTFKNQKSFNPYCTLITVWFSSATKSDHRRLQRVVRTAERIIGTTLPTLQELYRSRVRAVKITLDRSHLLPSG